MEAHQAPPSLGFSRQEHWSGLPFPSPMHESEKWKESRSVVSDSVRPHGLQPTSLLCPWDFPGKHTGVGCHCLLRYVCKFFTNICCNFFTAKSNFPTVCSLYLLEDSMGPSPGVCGCLHYGTLLAGMYYNFFGTSCVSSKQSTLWFSPILSLQMPNISSLPKHWILSRTMKGPRFYSTCTKIC